MEAVSKRRTTVKDCCGSHPAREVTSFASQTVKRVGITRLQYNSNRLLSTHFATYRSGNKLPKRDKVLPSPLVLNVFSNKLPNAIVHVAAVFARREFADKERITLLNARSVANPVTPCIEFGGRIQNPAVA